MIQRYLLAAACGPPSAVAATWRSLAMFFRVHLSLHTRGRMTQVLQ